jgi:hypothetical protein
MKKSLFSAAIAVLVTTGCTTTVNLTVKNPTRESQSVIAAIKDKGATKQELNLGTLEPGKDVKSTFPVEHDKDLAVSSTARGYVAWRSTPVTITSAPDPRNLDETINLSAQYVDEASAVQTVIDDFSRIGKNYQLLPIQARQAVDKYLGALLVMVPPQEGGHGGMVLFRIPPSQFLGISGERSITYADTNSSHQTQMPGWSAQRLSDSFPILKFGTDYSYDSLYDLRWSLKGFGDILAAEPPTWSLFTAIDDLSDTQKAAIDELMMVNPSTVLLYINRIYAVRDGYISRKHGRKLEPGATLDASSYLTPSGAWTFSDSATDTKHFAEAVLYMGGEVVQTTFLRMSPGTPDEPRTLSGPQGLLRDMKVFSAYSSVVGRETWRTVNVRRTGINLNLSPVMVEP